MTSLKMIERQLNIQRREKAPAPDTSGLGTAIQQLIDQAVQQQVAEALAREKERTQHNPRIRELMRDFNAPAPSNTSPPPAPRTPAPTMQGATIQRDELGRATVINIGALSFRVIRDELGRASSLVPADSVPPQPAIEPPALNAARQYKPGEPR